AELTQRFRGTVDGAMPDAADRIAFLRGLVEVSRELLWRIPELLAETDRIIAGLDEDRFVELLPHLRLAFAALDPRETDRLAHSVAAHLGIAPVELAGAVQYDASAAEVERNLALAARLAQETQADGLAAWLGGES